MKAGYVVACEESFGRCPVRLTMGKGIDIAMILVRKVVERDGETVGRAKTYYGIAHPVLSRNHLKRCYVFTSYRMLLSISRHCEQQNTCQ